MRKAHTIHAGQIEALRAGLLKLGFKRSPLAAWEQLRMEHPTKGKVIISSGYTNNPFPAINENGWKLWQEITTRDSAE